MQVTTRGYPADGAVRRWAVTSKGGWERPAVPIDYDDDPSEEKAEREAYWIDRRRPDRTYISKSFEHNRPNSSDKGQPARFISKVFDVEHETEMDAEAESWTVRSSPKSRVQVKLLVVRSAGTVKQLLVHKFVTRRGGRPTSEVLLDLSGEDARRLIELIANLSRIPIEGAETVRIDDSLLQELLGDPTSLTALYHRDPERFRQLISDDQAAQDVIAVAARRSQVEKFERLLSDADYFEEQRVHASGPEAVWQRFFEENPWIFGCTLTGQFLTSWDANKLEQVVSGGSIGSAGKRADAVMRTAGLVRSMVFAEIKPHTAQLLQETKDPYRSGCWAPHSDLAGGVAQVQGTVQLATEHLGVRIASTTADGSEIPGDLTYLYQPRSFLVIGHLGQLKGDGGGDHIDKVRSFELYRRYLSHPEVVTFDELLERARWLVDLG